MASHVLQIEINHYIYHPSIYRQPQTTPLTGSRKINLDLGGNNYDICIYQDDNTAYMHVKNATPLPLYLLYLPKDRLVELTNGITRALLSTKYTYCTCSHLQEREGRHAERGTAQPTGTRVAR